MAALGRTSTIRGTDSVGPVWGYALVCPPCRRRARLADGCVSGLGARINWWWIGIDCRDLDHAGECRRHCGVHRRIDAHRDVGHLNAAQHIADLAYVARHE